MDGSLQQLDLPADSIPISQAGHRSRLPWLLLLAGVFSFFCLDQSLGQKFAARPVRGELSDLLSAAEHFGTPYGQLLILLSILTVQQFRAPRVVRIFTGAAVAGLTADVIKMLLARTRPRGFDFHAGTVLDTFTGWFPLGAGGSNAQSFPSAHTACAFAFAALLVWAYPAGRRAFVALALLAGLQRICAGAHFPSDVCCGAALGWMVGESFVRVPAIASRFDRLEAWWLQAAGR